MKKRLSDRIYPYLLVLPATVLLFGVLIYPLGYSVSMSAHNWTLLTIQNDPEFVGLQNYLRLLSSPDFWNSFIVTATFMVFAIAFELLLGMALALILHQELVGKRIFRSLVILPFMATNVVIGLGWRMLYNYEYGILNWFVNLLGFQSVPWINSPQLALASLLIVDVWNTVAFVVLISLAGLQALPDAPIESAVIDGANKYQIFTRVMLPLLKSTILVILVWRGIDTFRIFDVPYILTGGGPAKATETLSIYAYRQGFQIFKLSQAAAASIVMSAFMIIYAFGLLRSIGSEEDTPY